jgi:hypothetical protein
MAFNFSSFETRGNYKYGILLFAMEKRRHEKYQKILPKVFSNLLVTTSEHLTLILGV